MAAQHQPAATAATPQRSSASSLLREVAEVVILAVILYLGVTFFVQAVHVEGLSMFATLDDGDYLMASKIDYRLHAPQRGDIVILRPPYSPTTDYVKRIIALPGERLLIRSAFVYINGHKLHEPYLPEEWTQSIDYPCAGCDSRLMGPNEYFVLGDNRNRSYDSRFFGPITRDKIDGKVLFRIFPLSHFGGLYGKVPTLETGSIAVGSAPLRLSPAV